MRTAGWLLIKKTQREQGPCPLGPGCRFHLKTNTGYPLSCFNNSIRPKWQQLSSVLKAKAICKRNGQKWWMVISPFEDSWTSTICIAALFGGNCRRRGVSFPLIGLRVHMMMSSKPVSSCNFWASSSKLLPLNVNECPSAPSSTLPRSSAMW